MGEEKQEQAQEQAIADFKGQARLPSFALPRRYEVFLKPDLSSFEFRGWVAITLDVLSPTRFLVLHAAALSVDSDSVSLGGNLKPCRTELVEDDEILVLEFASQLPLGPSLLRIGSFRGTLNDDMRGFYRSRYHYEGDVRYMCVTQFEAVDARRCFPCWDEPAFKAHFKITLEVDSDLVALSNMPLAHQQVHDSAPRLKTVSFEESPLMSTYLVAIVVGHFDYIQAPTPDGVQVRVYTQVGKTGQGRFALDVALSSLNLYKE